LKPGWLVGRVRAVNNEARQASVVSGSQVMAAGFASTAAAFVTSRFGVAGTLLGAALTAMIITGGSAILRAYLESVTGNVRKVPRKLRERRNRWKAGRTAEPPDTMPGRPDLRDNFAGRMRAALGWFSHLPALTRRSILIKGLIAAAVAFVVGMAAVYGVEQVIGNSLSCGIWAKCPEGATPGIKLGGGDGTGANPSLSLGRARTNPAAPGNVIQDRAPQQNPSQQSPSQQSPSRQNPLRQNPSQQNPSGERVAPGRQPAPRDNAPGGGILRPDKPVDHKPPAQQPESPNSASPAPGEQPPPGGGSAPADESASPAAPSQ
jgi:hypothetical protein